MCDHWNKTEHSKITLNLMLDVFITTKLWPSPLSLHTPTQYYDNSFESRLKLIFTYVAILKGVIYVFSERNIVSYHSNMHDFWPKKATELFRFQTSQSTSWWSRGAGSKQTERRGRGEGKRLLSYYKTALLTQQHTHNMIHMIPVWILLMLLFWKCVMCLIWCGNHCLLFTSGRYTAKSLFNAKDKHFKPCCRPIIYK